MACRRVLAAVAAAAVVAPVHGGSPRGWNSWDSYMMWYNGSGNFGNANESALMAAASYMADNLLAFGWDTVVVDEGWWWSPDGFNESVDAWGRPYPHPYFYPSAADGRGFASIAERLHDMGLKLGVWTLRGLPAVAVEAALPIAGSNYTVADAVGPAALQCSWNSHTVPSNAPSPAAAAYYDSVAAWFAQQGVDYVKVDCMFPNTAAGPYFDGELAAYTAALARYNLTVSLSPGTAVTTGNASYIAATGAAAVYRVTPDFWDVWPDPNGPGRFPSGLRSKLDVAVAFAPYFGANGSWPDLDMLPLGRIATYTNGSWVGGISESTFTPGQAQLIMTLWAVTGAPMMLGGRLPLLPNETALLALLTNSEALLDVHDGAVRRWPVTPTSGGTPLSQYAWAAVGADGTPYVALLNGDTWEQEIDVAVADLQLPPGVAAWCAWDVWAGYYVPGRFNTTVFAWVAGEAALLFRLEPCTTLAAALTVDVATQWRAVSPALYSAFLEDINHAVEGGLSAQMVQDYQCSQTPTLTTASLQPVTALDAYLQHCCFTAYASTAAPLADDDAVFAVVSPGLSGVPGTVSFESVPGSWPGYYLAASAAGVLHLAPPNASDPTWPAAATFNVTPLAATNPYVVTLAATLPALAGALLRLQAACSVPACCTNFDAQQCSDVAFDAGASRDDPATHWYLAPPLATGAAWQVAPSAAAGATLAVVQDGSLPLNANTSTALRLDASAPAPLAAGGGGGVCNTGFWGMAVAAGAAYNVSLWAAVAGAAPVTVAVTLESQFGDAVYAAATLVVGASGAPRTWAPYATVLTAAAGDAAGSARLCLRLTSAGGGGGAWATSVWLKGVSCLPPATYAGHGMRPDLAAAVAAIAPPTVRFPGGTYVCGANMSEAYNFSAAVGPWITRPGHWDFWGYPSEDLVGMHEYLQFIEDIGAAGVWVLNAGMSTTDYVPPAQLAPWVDNALASLAYALGDAATDWWAARRAAAGHPAPFRLAAVAIGNENCAGTVPTAQYAANYAVIAAAVTAAWPNLTLIANCDLTAGGTNHTARVDLWDYHSYQGLAANWLPLQYLWDTYPRSPGVPAVYNSEYATMGEAGIGNLAGALGEAVWMTGLERNSDVVPMAAYAPLFSNNNDRHWTTDAINFNTTSWYGTPSYWNQVLFASASPPGARLLAYAITTPAVPAPPAPFAPGVPLSNTATSLSTTVAVAPTGDVIIKVVNVGGNAVALALTLTGAGAALPAAAQVATITADDPRSGNSPAAPTAVAIARSTVPLAPAAPVVPLPPQSINVITLPAAARYNP